MKRTLLLGLLISTLFMGARVRSTPAGDSSFQVFLRKWEEAQARFVAGDPAPWKQLASQRGDVTILGAFGGYEKGWSEVGPRYDWASSQYKDSGTKMKVEYINTGVSGNMGFTVAIERQADVRLGGQQNPTQRALRVTQIFRKEGGAWKLMHRHADPLMEKKAPSAAPPQ